MGKWGLAVIGLAVLAVGVVLGAMSIGVGSDVECGSVFSPDYSSAQLTDAVYADSDLQGGYESDCRDAISDRKPIAYGVAGVGALALVAGLAVAQATSAKEPEQK